MKKIILAMLFLILVSVSCSSEKKPRLNVFAWSEYFSPEVIHMFEKEFDCRVIIDTYDSNEAMYAKLKLGAAGYDVIMPSNYIFEILVEQDMLHALDTQKMTNMKFLSKDKLQFLENPTSPYGIPFIITYTGIGYQKNRIENFEPSWTIFGRSDLRGRMTMLNDLRETLGAALITLGYSINTRNPEELNQAADKVIEWKKNIAKFESEQYKNGLASAEYLAVQAFSSDIMQVYLDEENVAFAFPKEGAVYSFDYLAIPYNSTNPELAQEFVNFLMRPQVASINMNYSLVSGFVDFDADLIEPILKDSKILNPPAEVREKAQLIRNVGDALDLYVDAWERVLTES